MYNLRIQSILARLNLVSVHLRRPYKNKKEDIEALLWAAQLACEAFEELTEEGDFAEVLEKLIELQESQPEHIKELVITIEEFVEAERQILSRIGLDQSLLIEVLDGVDTIYGQVDSNIIDRQVIQESVEVLQGAACNISYAIQQKLETTKQRQILKGVMKGAASVVALTVNASSLFPTPLTVALSPVAWKSATLGASLIKIGADEVRENN